MECPDCGHATPTGKCPVCPAFTFVLRDIGKHTNSMLVWLPEPVTGVFQVFVVDALQKEQFRFDVSPSGSRAAPGGDDEDDDEE
jgi:hypothetical protein